MLSTSLKPEAAADASKSPDILLASAGFVGDSIVDGPGLRCTLFVQGCPHGCPACHNPQTHPFTGGIPFTADELLEKIKAYPLCRGITFSGGEPMCQAQALLPLARALRGAGYELAIYTGYTFEQLLCGGAGCRTELLRLSDTLIDGPFILAQRSTSLRFRGSANQRILNTQKSLAKNAAVPETAGRWAG